MHYDQLSNNSETRKSIRVSSSKTRWKRRVYHTQQKGIQSSRHEDTVQSDVKLKVLTAMAQVIEGERGESKEHKTKHYPC